MHRRQQFEHRHLIHGIQEVGRQQCCNGSRSAREVELLSNDPLVAHALPRDAMAISFAFCVGSEGYRGEKQECVDQDPTGFV